MNFNENSILSTMNPFLSVLGFVCVVLISFFSARRYRNTNDVKRSLICAMILFIVMSIILALFGFPAFLIVGYGFCTFIITSWFSNYFFYH